MSQCALCPIAVLLILFPRAFHGRISRSHYTNKCDRYIHTTSESKPNNGVCLLSILNDLFSTRSTASFMFGHESENTKVGNKMAIAF